MIGWTHARTETMKSLIILLSITKVLAFDDRDAALFELIRHGGGSGRDRQDMDNAAIRTFSNNHPLPSQQKRQRFLKTDYINACHNPGLLYEGTGDSGRCICDEEFTNADRVLCVVEGIQCKDGLCTEEMDIWIFNKDSGRMQSRSTCVVCADETENCDSFDDTCFNAVFDEEETMTECSLMLQDSKPVVSCSNCSPCQVEDAWGMKFDCFEGRWMAEECVTGSRVGHLPEFPVKGDPGYVEELRPSRTGDTFSDSIRRNPNQGVGSQDNTMWLLLIIISGSALVGILAGIYASMRCSTDRNQVRPHDSAPPKPESALPKPESGPVQVPTGAKSTTDNSNNSINTTVPTKVKGRPKKTPKDSADLGV